MHHSRLTETAENLKKEFEQIFQENINLKMHIKDQEEKCSYYASEITKAHSFIHELQSQLAGLRRCAESERRIRRIKMGADWFIEGDLFVDIGLVWNVALESQISCIEVAGDIIAVICNTNLFVLHKQKKIILMLEEQNERFIDIHHKTEGIRSDQPILCKFSKCEKYLFTVTSDSIIRKWDVNSLELIMNYESIKERIVGISVIKEDLYFCTDLFKIKGYNKEGALFYDSKGIIDYPQGRGLIRSFIIAKEGKYSFISTNDRKLVIFNLEEGTYKENIIKSKNNQNLNISTDEALIAVGEGVNKINYEEMELEPIYDFIGDISAISFIIGSNYIITGGNEVSIRIIDIEKNKNIRINVHPHGIVNIGVGKGYFCSSGVDKRLRVWEYKMV